MQQSTALQEGETAFQFGIPENKGPGTRVPREQPFLLKAAQTEG